MFACFFEPLFRHYSECWMRQGIVVHSGKHEEDRSCTSARDVGYERRQAYQQPEKWVRETKEGGPSEKGDGHSSSSPRRQAGGATTSQRTERRKEGIFNISSSSHSNTGKSRGQQCKGVEWRRAMGQVNGGCEGMCMTK